MKTVIIGGGIAGLAAACRMKGECVVLEKEQRPGGLCRTENRGGFIFDYTGHFLHMRKNETKKFIFDYLRVPVKKTARKAFIFSKGAFTRYPYQSNNYGLPSGVIEENLAGFLKAKFSGRKKAGNFKEWVISAFGEGIAKNFMLPYNEKFWKYPLDKLTLRWMGRFVPSPSIEDVVKGLEPKESGGAGYNVSFYYPKKGGIEEIIKKMREKAEKNIITGAEVKKIDTKNRYIYYGSSKIKYEKIISTMPLNKMAKITGIKKLKERAGKLRAVSVYALNIGFKPGKKINMHWVYFPEKKFPFYRAGFPSAVCSRCAPAGYNSAFAEVSFSKTPPRGVKEKIINGLLETGIIRKRSDIKMSFDMVIKDAYVIYDREREKIVPFLKKELAKRGIYTAGRWGNWEYSSMEDAILEGFGAADRIAGQK